MSFLWDFSVVRRRIECRRGEKERVPSDFFVSSMSSLMVVYRICGEGVLQEELERKREGEVV